MKKIILAVAIVASAICLYSFKTSSGDGAKTVLISIMNGKGDNEGYIITHGDGKVEKRPFDVKIKPLDSETFVQLQAKQTVILNEFVEKGYRIIGTGGYNGAIILVKN